MEKGSEEKNVGRSYIFKSGYGNSGAANGAVFNLQPSGCPVHPFKAYINERIEAARPHWIPASVMLQEIR